MRKLFILAQSESSYLKKATFIAILAVIVSFVPYIFVSKIINLVFKGVGDFGLYLKLCVVILLAYMLNSILYAKALSVSHEAAFNVIKEIRNKIVDKLPKMSLGSLSEMSSGEMKQIIVDQVENIETPLAHLVPEMISNIVGPIFIFIYLVTIDWRMALVSLVSVPIGLLIMKPALKIYGNQYAGSVKTHSEMNSSIVEYINGIEVIKTFNQGEISYDKFADKINSNAKYFYNWMKSSQASMSFSRAIMPTTMITVLPVGWLLYINGNLSLDKFVICILLSQGLLNPLMKVINFVDALARVSTTVSQVDSILMAKEQEHSNESIKLLNHNIEMHDVYFSYNEDKEILHKVNLFIKENTKNALVGQSGSGKSTIAKLLAGYWDINEGSIKLGSVELKDIPLRDLYSKIAFVSQDNFLFDDTIRENIRKGNLKASDEEVEEIARKSGCYDFIMNLENGFDTKAGNGGSHLSGGQIQRISIARAMLKNAPIIILDEATSYMDPENEAIVQEAISKLIENKTVITIAHRLSTIVDSDKIFLVDNGSIISSGTHKELLDKSDLYKKMWQVSTNRGEEDYV